MKTMAKSYESDHFSKYRLQNTRTSAAQLTIVEFPGVLLKDIPILTLSMLSVNGLCLLLKRVIDLLGSAVLLTILSPTFLAVAAVIKLTSPGPVLFRQTRLGLNRSPFTMLKFRTMVVGAHQQQGLLHQSKDTLFFKIKDDPRVTRVGAFLRKYSLDELPQLINVLIGNMSLVGPRPILDTEYQRFSGWQQLRRFSMKPGLTCIWQISGRSNTSDEDRMRYDLKYTEEWSLQLDIKLLIKAIPVIFKGDGAV